MGKGEFLSPNAHMNVAIPVSADSDALKQAKMLVSKMRKERSVDFNNDWKVSINLSLIILSEGCLIQVNMSIKNLINPNIFYFHNYGKRDAFTPMTRKHPGEFGTQATKLNQHSMDWCGWWLWGSVSNIPDSYLNNFPVQVERRTATA